MKYKLLAKAYDKKGRLLSAKFNDYSKSHPLFKAYSLRNDASEHKIYQHAEFSALISANKEVHLLTVERYGKTGNLLLAKPCIICQNIIKDFGVKVLQYTSENGWITEELN